MADFNVVLDPILDEVRAEFDNGSGGSGGSAYVGGNRINIAGGTISFVDTADIQTVSGSSVTIVPNTAYKIYATTSAVTINATPPAAGKWAYEGHLEIFVASTGYIVTGSNVVLANALEPDAVNNCTVRFHDGLAIISVEDHVAGYIVVSATGSTAGTLPYALGSASQEYVAFDATLNGQTLDMGGATTNGEKHVVGNGYTETILSGAVNCGTSKFTVANLALSDVQVTGGTMTLGDAYIPSGATVSVSGGGLAVEKVSGNSGVIDLGGTTVPVSFGSTVSASGCTFSGGSTLANGGAFSVPPKASLHMISCILTGNSAGTGGALYVAYNAASVVLEDCVISGNTATNGAGLFADKASLYGCTVSGNAPSTDIRFTNSSASVYASGCVIGTCAASAGILTLAGSNQLDSVSGASGTVALTSGAILDLTGNTNTTPIAPGGGITFEAGGATVLYGEVGSVSSMFIDNLKPMEIRSGGVVNTSSGDMRFPNSAGASAVISGGIISGGRILNNNGGAILIKDATVNNQVVVQNLEGSGVVKLAGTVNLTKTNAHPIINTRATSDTWNGVVNIEDNSTISATITTMPIANAIGTLNVGSNVTINGTTVTSGMYTSATINADGTITEA